jgi:hypothetical protein
MRWEASYDKYELLRMAHVDTIARVMPTLAATHAKCETGAPEEQIEITEEMAEAGYDALFDEPRFPECGKKAMCNALAFAFVAMLRVRQKQSSERDAPVPANS